MSKQIEPGLDRAVASTTSFDETLEDYECASQEHSAYFQEAFVYGELFNSATDILSEVTDLRRRFFTTEAGNEMKYHSPAENEFEVMIKSINIIRCQLSDLLTVAEENRDQARKEIVESKKVLRAMADLKSEAEERKGVKQ